MQNKILRKGLFVGIIILFVGTSIVPSVYGNSTILKSNNINIQQVPEKGNILIYATCSYDSWDYYDKTHYTDLAQILQDYGYYVTLTDGIETPTVTESLLSNYNELWIINSEYDWVGSFTQTEISTILNYRNEGNGLLISADNTDPPGGGFAHSANQISIPLGVTFYGLANHGGPSIQPNFEEHPLFEGVTTIHGNINEAYLSINSPAESVATYQGDYIIAVLEPKDGTGRVVFDNTILRFMNGESYIQLVDTPQYIKNIADWLYIEPVLKIVFVFGKISNLDTTGIYIKFDAIKIRWIQFVPFAFIPYTSGEHLSISTDYRGLVTPKFIFAICKAPSFS